VTVLSIAAAVAVLAVAAVPMIVRCEDLFFCNVVIDILSFDNSKY
jgi:hypothetical protein